MWSYERIDRNRTFQLHMEETVKKVPCHKHDDWSEI